MVCPRNNCTAITSIEHVQDEHLKNILKVVEGETSCCTERSEYGAKVIRCDMNTIVQLAHSDHSLQLVRSVRICQSLLAQTDRRHNADSNATFMRHHGGPETPDIVRRVENFDR